MKTALLVMFALGILCLSITGCGSKAETPTLSVQPASAFLAADYSTGFDQFIELKAVLSNGQAPLSPQWVSSDACVSVNQGVVFCNISCPGSYTSTITVRAGGQSASSFIACSVH